MVHPANAQVKIILMSSAPLPHPQPSRKASLTPKEKGQAGQASPKREMAISPPHFGNCEAIGIANGLGICLPSHQSNIRSSKKLCG